MGTKRQLASIVRELVDLSPPGPILDVFAGMCAVGTAVADKRQVWTNDLQHFAHTVAYSHFCSVTGPPTRLDAVAYTMASFSAHVGLNCGVARSRIDAESSALRDESSEALCRIYGSWEVESRLPCLTDSQNRSATLFRDTFAGSYFGLNQCIEIDALRRSIDFVRDESLINQDEHCWLILALCVALSKASTSTGHFAQPLTPKPSNIKRFARQRNVSIKSEWLKAIDALKPIGTAEWRRANRAFIGDADLTISSFEPDEAVPAVVYADPPYTNDQYSRYYHLYETLILYDYPTVTGKGRYRPDRAVSSYSLATKVEASLLSLITHCARIGCDLVISYPRDGLLKDSRQVIPSMIKEKFGRDPQVKEIAHRHSTMGASKGAGKQDVVEVLYRAFH